jgi:hypothetical protein
MRIELQDPFPAPHWRAIEQLIATDPHLRQDVTMRVNGGVARFTDATGQELPVVVPPDLSESDLEERNGQLRMVVWLWWTFGSQPAAQDHHRSDRAA